MSNPTSNWERIGESFYRKTRQYEAVFDAELDLADHIIAAAPFAGAIAVYPSSESLERKSLRSTLKSTIDIYSLSGRLLRQIKWEQGGSIRGLGWSEDEKLLVVSADRTVRCYYGLQADFTQFSLGAKDEESRVISCRFWATGFVALLSDNQLITINDYNEPRAKSLATTPESTIHSWTVIPPSYSLSRSVEVLLAIDESVYLVDANACEDRVLPNGPFRHVSISPNGAYLALLTQDKRIWVITSDFQKKLGEHESDADTLPDNVIWCGNDAIVLSWQDEVHLMGISGGILKYYYDGWIHVLPEIDSARIIAREACDLMQRIPDVTVEVFRLGSSSPASILLDALEQLEEKSPKANENIELIRSELPDAISSCISAAAYEYNPHLQGQLLKAASFGKSMLELYDSDDFVNTCDKLRILNAVRDYKIGLPLTYEQFECIGTSGIIDRLVNRGEYLLAVRLSEFSYLSSNHVYIHWAAQKARHGSGDEEAVYRTIFAKLSSKEGLSYESIARAAHEEGRSALAKSLLDHEPSAGKQVLLLLSMSEDEAALDKAIMSGDTDLVLHVLLHIKKTVFLSAFFRILNNRPLATALVEASAIDQDQDLLKDLYYQDDRPLDSARLLFSQALDQSAPQTKIDKLKLSAKQISDSSKVPAAIAMQKVFQEAQQLTRIQASLDRDNAADSNVLYMGKSVNETIHQLILDDQIKRAQKVAQDFSVPAKTFDWIRLRALVAARNFHALEEIGNKNRRSAIGWTPYFNEILAAGNVKLAGSVFVAKCTNLSARQRAEMWVKCGMTSKAGEELVKMKDVEGLEKLKRDAGATGSAEIERMLASLNNKR